MEGQITYHQELEGWAARAAQSYQELAKTFSSYVTKQEEPEEGRGEKQGNAITMRLCHGCLHKEDCCRGEEVEEGCNLAVFMNQMKRTAFNQMMEGKEALVQQLEETARFFQHVQGAICKEEFYSEEQKKELEVWLRRYHIRARKIQTRHLSGKGRELQMQMKCDGAGRAVSMRLIERLLEEKLGFPVKECSSFSRYLSEEERQVVFREEPGYYVTTGVARSVKQEQDVSGDSFSFFYEEDGEMAMILSDGMGSGETAARESESILRLLE